MNTKDDRRTNFADMYRFLCGVRPVGITGSCVSVLRERPSPLCDRLCEYAGRLDRVVVERRTRPSSGGECLPLGLRKRRDRTIGLLAFHLLYRAGKIRRYEVASQRRRLQRA